MKVDFNAIRSAYIQKDALILNAKNSLNNTLTTNDSTNFEAFYIKGLISFLEGQYIQSIKEFDFAINIGNKKVYKIYYGINGECYFQKGLAFLKLNKKEEACTSFKEASKMNVFNVGNLILENCK